MADETVAFVLTDSDPACREAGAVLFPGVPAEAFTREELRPPAPFAGRLFDAFRSLPRGSVVAVVVPVLKAGASGLGFGDLAPVTDHVNLEPRGPLTGRWPDGVPRDFPSMTGVYQPRLIRPGQGARVYSSGVVAAGVACVRRLTPFEARVIREGGWPIMTDSLVPAAIVAAYHGMRLAACGLVQAALDDRE